MEDESQRKELSIDEEKSIMFMPTYTSRMRMYPGESTILLPQPNKIKSLVLIFCVISLFNTVMFYGDSAPFIVHLNQNFPHQNKIN